MTRPGAPLSDLFGRAMKHVTDESTPTTEETALDAALEVLAEHGTERATMDDVAEASGISRATLFRRFGGKDRLFELALAHALRAFLASVEMTFRTVTDPTDRIAEAFAACLALRERLLRTRQPARQRWGELLAMLDAGSPSPLEICHHFIAARIAAGQAEGTLPPGDPDLRAEAILRVTIGYLLIPSTHIDFDDPVAVREFARNTIAPLVTGPR